MAYADMRFEGDYLKAEFDRNRPRLEAGETMDAINPVKAYRHRLLAQRIAARIGPGGRVLEIGCGASLVLAEAAKLGLACRGADMDELMLEYSALIGKSYGVSYELGRADAFALPFPDDTFDYVFSVGMLEHYSPADQLLIVKEQRRVSRGWVEIDVPNEGANSSIFHILAGHEDSHLDTDLVALARDAGLTELEQGGRSLFVPGRAALENSPGYQDWMKRRFPALLAELGPGDIPRLIEAELTAMPEELVEYGSIHFVIGRAV